MRTTLVALCCVWFGLFFVAQYDRVRPFLLWLFGRADRSTSDIEEPCEACAVRPPWSVALLHGRYWCEPCSRDTELRCAHCDAAPAAPQTVGHYLYPWDDHHALRCTECLAMERRQKDG